MFEVGSDWRPRSLLEEVSLAARVLGRDCERTLADGGTLPMEGNLIKITGWKRVFVLKEFGYEQNCLNFYMFCFAEIILSNHPVEQIWIILCFIRTQASLLIIKYGLRWINKNCSYAVHLNDTIVQETCIWWRYELLFCTIYGLHLQPLLRLHKFHIVLNVIFTGKNKCGMIDPRHLTKNLECLISKTGWLLVPLKF